MAPAPRIPPLALEDMDGDTAALVRGTLRSPDGEPLNIFRTLAHHPKALRRFMALGTELLLNSSLSARDRELVILRTGWNCGSAYEWGQHVAIARAVGLTDDDITRAAAGPDAHGWTEGEALLLRVADELHHSANLTDETFAELAAGYPPSVQVEVMLLVGYYHMVAFFLNAAGVEREAGVEDLPGR